MRILHLISGLKGGGAEHFVLELCRQCYGDWDNEMSVLSIGATDEISHKFHEAGIDVVSASAPSDKKILKALRALRLLLKGPREIIHAHMYHACIVACIAKMFRPSMKIIFTLHNNRVPNLFRQLSLFLTIPLRKADIIFPGMKRRWFQKRNTIVIPNGVDVFRFEDIPIPKSTIFTFVFVGRLEYEKNPLFLIDLAKSLPDKNFKIVVAGAGPLRKVLEEKILAEKMSEYFEVVGYENNVPVLLSRSHCLLLPSLWEGMPLILLEAAVVGIPVIATPVGIIPSLVSEYEGYVGELNTFAEMLKKVRENYGEALLKAKKLKRK